MALCGPTSPRTWALRIGALALAYWVCARVGLLMPQFSHHAALMWPPAGLALAIMLRWGHGAVPGIWLGSFVATLSSGVPIGLAALIAAGNALGPALGAAVLRRRGLHFRFDRRQDLVLYMAIGAGWTMLLTSGNATFWLTLSARMGWVDASGAWMQRWLGDAMGAVAVGIPLLLTTSAACRQALIHWKKNMASAGIAFSVLASAALLFAFSDSPPIVQSPLLCVPHLLICWLTVRSGLWAASSTALLVVTAAGAMVGGFGPVDAPAATLHGSLLASYLGTLLAMPVLICALISELTANKRGLQRVMELSQLGVGEWDLTQDRIVLSSDWLSLLGHTSQEFGTAAAAFWAQVHPDHVALVQRGIHSLHDKARDEAGTEPTSTSTSTRVECRMHCADGHWRWLELHTFAIERNSFDVPVRLITTARDITDVQAAREQHQLCEIVLRNLHEGLLITDPQQRVIEVNPAYCAITGYSRAELIGSVPRILLPAETGSEAANHQAAMRASLAAAGIWHGVVADMRRNGEDCVLQVTLSLVQNADSSVRNYLFTATDITHARLQLEQLQRQTHFDELTRLPNRARLAQMLQTAMETSRRDGSLLAVCCFDLDHFKPINDQFGHEAGDRLLLELANRLRRSLRSWAGGNDVVARIGGDEFVLLLRTATLEESRHAVNRLLSQLSQPYDLSPTSETGATTVVVTASIGVTVFPLDSADADTLVRHADHAMYGAKQAGRNGYLFFDAEHDRRAEARFVALGRVQEALDANEFRLYYQPKVDMQNVKVLGVEALLRWKHPEQGVILPAQFLPLIENTGLSISVGNWVLQQGIEQLARWLHLGMDITVSVNISARHLQEPLFAQHLTSLLLRYPSSVASHLVIEVLETTALADIDYTCSLMEACRTLGVRFALDDFGTGYSTFTYLKQLPIDMLKIDRSFVTHMLSDRQDLAIVEGVIGLSQTFGCSVVAEGVETLEQAQRLIEIGCIVGQGNGIAAAMPASEVPSWVARYCGAVGLQAVALA